VALLEYVLIAYLVIAALFATMGLIEWRSSREARALLAVLAAVFWPVALIAVVVGHWLAHHHGRRPKSAMIDRDWGPSYPRL
jgi:hypothetical protein